MIDLASLDIRQKLRFRVLDGRNWFNAQRIEFSRNLTSIGLLLMIELLIFLIVQSIENIPELSYEPILMNQVLHLELS